MMLFKKVDGAKAVLASKTGTYSEHDIYRYKDGRLFARAGNSMLLLYHSRITSKKSVRIFELVGLETEHTQLGYLKLLGEQE